MERKGYRNEVSLTSSSNPGLVECPFANRCVSLYPYILMLQTDYSQCIIKPGLDAADRGVTKLCDVFFLKGWVEIFVITKPWRFERSQRPKDIIQRIMSRLTPLVLVNAPMEDLSFNLRGGGIRQTHSPKSLTRYVQAISHGRTQ